MITPASHSCAVCRAAFAPGKSALDSWIAWILAHAARIRVIHTRIASRG